MYGEFNRFEFEDWIKNIEDREIRELASDLCNLMESYRKYDEGDVSWEDYLHCKKDFKQKWLRKGMGTKRLQATCNKAIEELRKELYDMIDNG